MSGGFRGGVPLSAQIFRRNQIQHATIQARLFGQGSVSASVFGSGGSINSGTFFAQSPAAYPPPVPPEAMADPKQPDTLGWRAWYWDHIHRVLCSPVQKTEWPTSELRCEEWSDKKSLRGTEGIHARRMPVDWRKAGWPDFGPGEGPNDNPWLVTGVVERFGRYVLGTVGWRAEWVMIRALMISTNTGGDKMRFDIERRYPDVPIFERNCETEWRRHT